MSARNHLAKSSGLRLGALEQSIPGSDIDSSLARLVRQCVKPHPSPGNFMVAAVRAAHKLYEEETVTNALFRRVYQSWGVFRYAQYQWHRIAKASFSKFMPGRQLLFR